MDSTESEHISDHQEDIMYGSCLVPSKTWCAHPWQHAHIDTERNRKLCCLSLPTTAKEIPMTEFWNSSYMKSVRRRMLAGKEVPDCAACYKNEAAGSISLRNDINRQISPEDLTEFLSKTDLDGYYHGTASYYDYRTIYCNLQCRSCSSYFSSQHIKLKNKMDNGNIISSDKHGFSIDRSYERECAKEIITGISDQKVKTLYWAGGEPMMSTVHWQVMEYLIEQLSDPKVAEYIKSISVIYHTNLTWVQHNAVNIPDMISKFNSTVLCSLDGTHETIEYTRDGVTWADIEENFLAYLNVLKNPSQVRIATVSSAPVIFDIGRYLEYYGKFNIYLHPHYLLGNITSPHNQTGFLNIKQYPRHIFYDAIQEAKSKVKESGINGAKRWLTVLTRYEREYKHTYNITSSTAYLEALKGQQLYRDSFNLTNRTLTDLYAITAPQANEWFNSLGIRVTSLAQEQYIKTLGLDYIKDY